MVSSYFWSQSVIHVVIWNMVANILFCENGLCVESLYFKIIMKPFLVFWCFPPIFVLLLYKWRHSRIFCYKILVRIRNINKFFIRTRVLLFIAFSIRIQSYQDRKAFCGNDGQSMMISHQLSWLQDWEIENEILSFQEFKCPSQIQAL